MTYTGDHKRTVLVAKVGVYMGTSKVCNIYKKFLRTLPCRITALIG